MLRCGRSVLLLKHRPKGVNTAVGSNRFMEDKYNEKAMEIFAAPPFPNKKVIHNWRFFIKPGKATTGPPLGQEFSKMGLKAMDFCKAFNDRTKPVFKDGIDLMVRVQVYFDKTYSYRIHPPTASWFLFKVARMKPKEGNSAGWVGYVTLEMLYEIAKMLQFDWTKPEYPPIEARVRSLVGQARRMGLCVIGVDAPNSPVKGVSTAEYDKQAEQYRAEQWQQLQELRQKQLDAAPLYEKLHRPNFSKLSHKELERSVMDPRYTDALWRASHPKSPFLKDLKMREQALKMVNMNRDLPSHLSEEEMRSLFLNNKLPDIERTRQLHGVDVGTTYYDR